MADVGVDRDEDAPGDEHEDEHRDEHEATAPGGWASWLLVAACAAPPLLLAEAARRVLGGDQDDEYSGWYAATSFDDVDAPAAEVPLGERFRLLWTALGLPGPLLAVVVGALLLTVVVLTGRPAPLVPDRWGRRVAAAAAWLSAAGSLAVLLALLGAYSAPGRDRRGRLPAIFGGGLPDDPPTLAAALAVLVPAVLVPALVGAALWRDGPVAREPAPAAARGPADEPTAEPPAEPPAETVREEPAATPEVPVVAETDRHLYRRPG